MYKVIVEVAILKMDHTWSTEDIELGVPKWASYEEITDQAEEVIRSNLDSQKIEVAHITTMSVRTKD